MPVPKGWRRKKLANWRRVCAPGSMRTKISGKAHVLICCPKGAWDSKRKRCKIGTRAVSIDKPGDRVAFGSMRSKIRDEWEVREWTERDAYGTSIPGVSLYRRGTLIAEGPRNGPPYRRTTHYIPRGLISDELRARFSRKRR